MKTIAGNVGINTTVPNATLHVVGKVILQAGFVANTTSVVLNVSNSTCQTLCYVDVNGDFYCSGTKSAVVSTDSFDQRRLYAVESPDVRHIDEGRAKLKNGFANVSIDPIFKETIEGNYNVYLTPEGKTKALYVAEKTNDYFIVKDTANTNAIFSYIISAYRRGYASKRLESGIGMEIIATIDETSKITDIEVKGSGIIENLNNNGQASNASRENANSSTNFITGNVINEVNLNSDLSAILSNDNTTSSSTTNNQNFASSKQNFADKFTINSIKEEEIIKEIEQKTNLDKDKIKRAIKFRKKEPVKDNAEENIPEEITQPTQSVVQLGYMTKVNGSVIIRLG